MDCNAGENQSTLCDVPPEMYQLLPDGVAGLLAPWRRATQQVAPHTFFVQHYVTRIDALGDRVDHPVAPDFAIDLIGEGDGVCSVGYRRQRDRPDILHDEVALSVSGALPVAALMDEGVALYDTETGIMSEVVDGTVSGTVTLSLEQPNQSRFGLRTGIDRTGATPRLASVIGLPLNEATTSFLTAGHGNPPGQNAPRDFVFDGHEEAALEWFEFIYPLSAASEWEWGGFICRQGTKFLWSRI